MPTRYSVSDKFDIDIEERFKVIRRPDGSHYGVIRVFHLPVNLEVEVTRYNVGDDMVGAIPEWVKSMLEDIQYGSLDVVKRVSVFGMKLQEVHIQAYLPEQLDLLPNIVVPVMEYYLQQQKDYPSR